MLAHGVVHVFTVEVNLMKVKHVTNDSIIRIKHSLCSTLHEAIHSEDYPYYDSSIGIKHSSCLALHEAIHSEDYPYYDSSIGIKHSSCLALHEAIHSEDYPYYLYLWYIIYRKGRRDQASPGEKNLCNVIHVTKVFY